MGCGICNTYYHIQSDPISAYDGVGIVCDICGKNRECNPEMLMEEHYYKCEGCENSDVCSPCYQKERKALNERMKTMNKMMKRKTFIFILQISINCQTL